MSADKGFDLLSVSSGFDLLSAGTGFSCQSSSHNCLRKCELTFQRETVHQQGRVNWLFSMRRTGENTFAKLFVIRRTQAACIVHVRKMSSVLLFRKCIWIYLPGNNRNESAVVLPDTHPAHPNFSSDLTQMSELQNDIFVCELLQKWPKCLQEKTTTYSSKDILIMYQ